jgi:hypothetical protein
VRELAEEIWTASSGDVLPARPDLDPRSSRAGASARAAYRRHRERERAGWRLGWVRWTAAVIGAAAVGDLVIGLSVGAWLGWPMGLLLAAWTGWRLLPVGGDPPPGSVGGLRGQARAVAETLEGWARVPVRALLCVHGPWPMTPRAADGVGMAAPGQLSGVVRSGPAATDEDLERATTRLLEVLRPAA